MFRVEENAHNEMILAMVRLYISRLHNQIKASHIGNGYVQPEEINHQIPDITSVKNGKFYVTEAETKQTIGTEETAEQWRAFSNYAKSKNGEFHIVVPASCLSEAQQFAKDEGISVDFWFYHNFN